MNVSVVLRPAQCEGKSNGPGKYKGTSIIHNTILSSFEGKEKESRRTRLYIVRASTEGERCRFKRKKVNKIPALLHKNVSDDDSSGTGPGSSRIR